jgi:hypothetical protein
MKVVTEMLVNDFGWLPIQNVAYSPNNNPIEVMFSLIKRKYKKEVIHADKNGSAHVKEGKVQKRAMILALFNEYVERLVNGAEKAMQKQLNKDFNFKI